MLLFWFTTDEQRRKVCDLILPATQAIVTDKQQSYDDFKWYRPNWQDIQTYKAGLTVDTSGTPWYIDVLAKILPPISEEAFDSSQLQLAKDTYIATAAAFGIIAVHDVFENSQRLQGGMFYQRMHLWAASNGLATQPMNQMTDRAERNEFGYRTNISKRIKGTHSKPKLASIDDLPYRISNSRSIKQSTQVNSRRYVFFSIILIFYYYLILYSIVYQRKGTPEYNDIQRPPLNAMDEIHCCGMALRMSPTSKRDKERRGRSSLKADANIIQ